MKVLVIASYIGANGGTGSHVLASVRALERAGLEVVVAVGQRGDLTELASPVSVIEGLLHRDASPATLRDLLDLADEENADVVHLHQISDGTLTERLTGAHPTVINIHNFVACTSGWKYFRNPGDECTRPHGFGCIANLYGRGCAHAKDPRAFPANYRRASSMVRAMQRADVVVAHSQFVQRHLETNGVSRCRLVPLFLRPLPDQTPLPPEPSVLFSGRVTRAKGLGVLLRSMQDVDARLVVAGDGWFLPSARVLADELGVADRVRYLGWCDEEELARAYRGATVVCVPSLWPEPFGLVGLEAMAHGRPTIASRTGGIPEWLVDGAAGSLVPAGDPSALARALRDITTNAGRAAEMGAFAARTVRTTFTEECYIESMLTAYDAACTTYAAGP